ncbi:hypothetical protein AMEX_G7028 [Astyanax mexicanus]|uniref:Uncharacterized protein n=1 Tax=Astyanax mexicanus TaxID=7994 RepID=A0A8T2M1F6_ASTMX|nr:hypothetical protein AMEX_G7028 [Astyanax mexicanus]
MFPRTEGEGEGGGGCGVKKKRKKPTLDSSRLWPGKQTQDQRGCASQSKPLSPPRDAVSIATTVSWEARNAWRVLLMGVNITQSTDLRPYSKRSQQHSFKDL